MQRSSETIGAIAAALAKAQAELTNPEKSLVATIRASDSILGEKIKADGTRLRTLGANALARGFLGVLRHQGLEFGLGSLWSRKAERVAQNRPANPAHELNSLMSTMRTASTRGAEARRRRGEASRRLNAAPEPALRSYEKMLVERIGGDCHLDPFGAAGDD